MVQGQGDLIVNSVTAPTSEIWTSILGSFLGSGGSFFCISIIALLCFAGTFWKRDSLFGRRERGIPACDSRVLEAVFSSSTYQNGNDIVCADPQNPCPHLATNLEGRRMVDSPAVIKAQLQEDSGVASYHVSHLRVENECDSEDNFLHLVRPFFGRVPRKDIRMIKVLGKGSFGRVDEVEINDFPMVGKVTGALKSPLGGRFRNMELLKLKTEIQVLLLLPEHENVVKMFGYSDSTSMAILFEYVPLRCLQTYLEERAVVLKAGFQTLEDNRSLQSQCETLGILLDFKKIADGVAAGMTHLAENGVVHRDLAPRNVLLDVFRTPKIADFGCAMIVGKEAVNKGLPREILPAEGLEFAEFSSKTDVWSFGLLLFDMVGFCQWKPYPGLVVEGPMDMAKKLNEGLRPAPPSYCSPQLAALIRHCMEQRPEDRPSFGLVRTAVTAVDFIKPDPA